MKTKMCGICGDYNGNPFDDWRVAQGCPENGVGEIVSELALFPKFLFQG